MVEKLKLWVPERRDMIWINFNPQSGKEMKDEHPMLVISPRPFNEKTGIVIGLPMTHAQFNETNPFAIKFSVGKGDPAYILTHQPKSFDWRLRKARPHPWKSLPPALFQEACEGLNSIIEIAH
ncbi:type II toxin-antitoxin system PemK/MazF family toxin [Polynucleobacter sp. MWH-Adler-W8]|jgi:mRNA interferase MazF|uniref:type II toxin-antitoxin system PemK/MazF family toxin n=1 Tax=Polynucleobacter sp. MWH-Adler-W8 TaxID=1819727 RepID=UPI00092B287C|nr:type II toxin-antitoxin system PemK/MazF family toxin [Polynucleobacter sp. MWH-Adler-W8]OJI05956.1 growth inhibitor PemK [Polynucleobacter sp. MWH-Adler-W8]